MGMARKREEKTEPAAFRLPSLGKHTGGPTLRSNGKCSNENAIMDNDLLECDLIG